MELIGTIFTTIFMGPIVNLLVLILKLFQMAGIPGALGFSIAVMTILIRLILWPFTASQVKSTQKMAALKPHLDELKKKHGSDKQAFASAQMALYKEHGVNPAGGCLPALIQIPVFIALYQSILNVVPTGSAAAGLNKINSLLYNSWLHLSNSPDPNFFGVNLTSRPSNFSHLGVLILLIPIITGLLTFIQSKMMILKPVKIRPNDSPKEVKEKETMDDAMASMQGQMVFLMPVMIGYFAFQFPVGLAIYWNTFTIMGIIQQYKISGWGGLTDLVGKLNKYGK